MSIEPSTADDLAWLRQALALAHAARERGESPFGAVLVESGRLFASAGDQVAGPRRPHGPRRAARHPRAGRFDLSAATLYASCKPCLMCAGALHWARVGRVVFSCSQAMLQEQSSGRLKPGLAQLLELRLGRPVVFGPLLPNEGLAVFDGFTFSPKASRLPR